MSEALVSPKQSLDRESRSSFSRHKAYLERALTRLPGSECSVQLPSNDANNKQIYTDTDSNYTFRVRLPQHIDNQERSNLGFVNEWILGGLRAKFYSGLEKAHVLEEFSGQLLTEQEVQKASDDQISMWATSKQPAALVLQEMIQTCSLKTLERVVKVLIANIAYYMTH